MRAIIVANGHVQAEENYVDLLQPDDLVIAANGGSSVALQLGLTPQVVIGDLDSLPPQLRSDLVARGCQFVTYPARKDETDTELAIRYALRAGAQEIVLLGAIGDRFDHSLANVLLLGMPDLQSIPATLIAGYTQLWLLHGGSELEFGGQPGDIVTLLPLGQDASDISTDGLEWVLNGATLSFGLARGVSNLMTSTTARVHLGHGLLLVTRIAGNETQETDMSNVPEASELVEVYATQGHLRANVAKSKLEAAGIPAMLSYDSASRVYGITVDGIGQVRILVRAEDAPEARRLLAEEHTSDALEP